MRALSQLLTLRMISAWYINRLLLPLSSSSSSLLLLSLLLEQLGGGVVVSVLASQLKGSGFESQLG